jgi:microcin C transport system permease protein
MSDDTRNSNFQSAPDRPGSQPAPDREPSGLIDDPRQIAAQDTPTIADQMLARQSIAISRLHPDVDRLSQQSAQREMLEATGDSTLVAPAARAGVSVLRKRINRFKSLRRGYYAFILLTALYILSFLLPLFVGNRALIVHYKGETYFPALSSLVPWASTFHPGTQFGQQDVQGEANYRKLNEAWKKTSDGNWIVMPLYHWDPLESDFEGSQSHPQAPSERHLFGTDETGRDVFARMCYGFNVSLSFAIVLTLVNYVIGGALGGLMGYFGGKTDLLGQRIQEIWENIPFLYTVIIISSILIPSFILLVLVLAVFGWMLMATYIRGEFLREKGKDYVAAAISLGASDRQIIFKHVLPNSLTPMISFFPFSIVGGISALVALDYLGFGLPAPTPSWGEMVNQGLQNLDFWWLATVPILAMFITLLLVTFIGEALREAFDPKVFSRLR